MNRITISIGDFLKNAGIVGLEYLLKKARAEENRDYGITDNKQGIWLDKEFAENANWTDLYFHAFVSKYGLSTAYQGVIDKIEAILDKAENENWDKTACKDDLKFINDKMLSNSWKSGFLNIKDKIENPHIYELLKTNKLKETMETEVLCRRLLELQEFLEQPLCEETFSMKGIIYNYINRFWDGKSFLLRTNASKDMKEVFEADFSTPLKKYIAANHEKAKELCIECGEPMDAKEKVSIAFMKDQADDLTRKRSAFWNCKVDAYLCPICAFIYALVPLGFSLVGNTFVFINMNEDIDGLLRANSPFGKLVVESSKEEKEKYFSWIARTMDIILQEKSRELGNIQVITRGMGENDRYTFDVIAKDIIRLFDDENIKKDLAHLGKYPFLKIGKDYWNVHENVILNLLRYQNQYTILNKLLKIAIETEGVLPKAFFVYDIQFRTNLWRKNKQNNIRSEWMNRYNIREEGYKLRNCLLGAKGTQDDKSIRGTIYQLLNALSVGNVERFMEIVMRIYCSCSASKTGEKLQIPNAFIEFLRDRDTFVEYGYAFLLGLQGSHYEKKEDKINE